MTPEELRPLAELAGARLQALQARMANITRRETTLRRQLSDLEDQFASAALASPCTFHRMQQLGAQNLWADWMQRKRGEHNAALARVLAEKSDCTAELRAAFGRNDALAHLMKDAVKEVSAKQAQKREDALLLQAALNMRNALL